MAAVLTEPDAPKAATLTSAGELTCVSFPITKVEETPDGDIVVTGTASDGTVDTDDQIVDPEWAQKGAGGLQEWYDTYRNVRVQHQSQRDPAGTGIDIGFTPDGRTVVKSLIVEPVAKELVRKGVLRAYSVGIANPVITHDPLARGGRIKGGQIVELSLVDRPANKNCGIQLVKAAGDGTPEFVGKVFGGDVAAEPAMVLATERLRGPRKTVTVEMPANMSVSISPRDLAKLATLRKGLEAQQQRMAAPGAVRPVEEAMAIKAAAAPAPPADPDTPELAAVKAAEAGVWKRDIGTATRRRLAAEGRALPNLSYPIETHEDAGNAVTLALSGHGDVGAAKKLIRRVARKEGWTDILDRLKDAGKTKAATADVAKCGTCGGKGTAGGKPCPDCKKGMRRARKAAAGFPKAQEAALTGALKALDQFAHAQTADAAKAALAGVEAAMAPLAKGRKKLKALCPGCGAKQNREHRHCPECGRELPPMAPVVHKNHDFVCLGCGKELDKGEKHCPECGRENPGYLPEADRKIPANQDAAKAAAGKGRVAKGRKNSGKPKGKTPASVGGAVSAAERPVGPHREPDGAEVEAFEADSGMSDGDSEQPTHMEAGTLPGAPRTKAAKTEPEAAKAGNPKKGKKGKPKGKKLPPWMQDKDGDDGAAEKSAVAGDPPFQAALRLESAGVPGHMGAAHDLTCPAYLPAEADLCHPGASLKTLDLSGWQEEVLEKAASADLATAHTATGVLAAAMALRAADPSDLADIREGAHKAFRDANPAMPHMPTPTQLSPERFHRPYLAEGHAAPSPGHGAPNHARIPAAGGIQPEDYRRGYLTAGHADESPANTHPAPPMPAPDRTGAPTNAPGRVFYRNSMREGDEHAMRVLHDHISGRFPAICPMHPHFADTAVPTPAGAPDVSPAPGTAGLGAKKTAPKAERKAQRAAKAARVAKRKAAKARDAAKAREARIARQVLKGTLTLQDAQAKLGLTAPVPEGVKTVEGAPEPLVATPVSQADITAATKAATAPLAKQIRAQGKALGRQRKVLDAIAGQPDTRGAPYRGTALPPKTTAPQAGVPQFTAKSAEQTRAENYARLYSEWATTTDPAAQEALTRELLPYWNPAMAEPPAHART